MPHNPGHPGPFYQPDWLGGEPTFTTGPQLQQSLSSAGSGGSSPGRPSVVYSAPGGGPGSAPRYPAGTLLAQTAQLNPLQWLGLGPFDIPSGSLADASEEQIIEYVTTPAGGGVEQLWQDPAAAAAAVPKWVWVAGGGALALALAVKFWPKSKAKK